VNGPATGNSPSGSGGIAGIKRFGGNEGGDFPSRNAGIGFQSADSAWYAALKEMKDLGAQYYPEEAKSRGFIPELGVEIHKRGGLYYYDQIARGFEDGALAGGVGLGDTGAVARGHMHWDSQLRSDGDRDNARAYSQAVPDYKAWVGSWDGFKLYWYNGKDVESGMPDWNRYKYWGTSMKTIAFAGALSLLFAGSTLCKANSGPWCKPDVVMLTFKNQQGRDFAKIELRSLKAVCDRNPERNGFGVGVERSMRIEQNPFFLLGQMGCRYRVTMTVSAFRLLKNRWTETRE
jgi:hypothetical protein